VDEDALEALSPCLQVLTQTIHPMAQSVLRPVLIIGESEIGGECYGVLHHQGDLRALTELIPTIITSFAAGVNGRDQLRPFAIIGSRPADMPTEFLGRVIPILNEAFHCAMVTGICRSAGTSSTWLVFNNGSDPAYCMSVMQSGIQVLYDRAGKGGYNPHLVYQQVWLGGDYEGAEEGILPDGTPSFANN
jgi:hypothetical protein